MLRESHCALSLLLAAVAAVEWVRFEVYVNDPTCQNNASLTTSGPDEHCDTYGMYVASAYIVCNGSSSCACYSAAACASLPAAVSLSHWECACVPVRRESAGQFRFGANSVGAESTLCARFHYQTLQTRSHFVLRTPIALTWVSPRRTEAALADPRQRARSSECDASYAPLPYWYRRAPTCSLRRAGTPCFSLILRARAPMCTPRIPAFASSAG